MEPLADARGSEPSHDREGVVAQEYAAIDHMKKILDDNTIDARDRDVLKSDVEDLRHLRVDRGNM